jgi:formamidopyrimidine-DNA glycosylase
MPELPEVETIRGHLAPGVEGRRLEAVEILDARWCRPLAPAELTAAVEGRVVEKLARRGKYLVWELSDDVFLLMHLRMTGTLLLDPSPAPRHMRVRIDLGDHQLVFDDPRRFGTGELALGPDALDAFFDARLGVEPLERDFTGDHLYSLAQTSRAPIKAFLLDQKRVAGVGNIYADEALFRARVHPLRPANRLTRAQATAIRDGVVESLMLGLEAKGATIDDFRHPDGASGSFQDRFLIHLREGEPCVRCGRTVVKMRAAGRGTYVCESCQPRPRAASRARGAGRAR